VPADSAPEVPPEAERAGVVAFPQPVCAACGGPREPQKREACSDRCRAALSRRRRAEAETTRQQQTETELAVSRGDLKDAQAVLEAISWLANITLTRLDAPSSKGGHNG
jgi:predicted nucleic acid-binding Zn ribbon protein